MFCKQLISAILMAALACGKQDFINSCERIELIEGHFLKLRCHHPQAGSIWEGKRDTSIDLGDCYTNKGGKLVQKPSADEG